MEIAFRWIDAVHGQRADEVHALATEDIEVKPRSDSHLGLVCGRQELRIWLKTLTSDYPRGGRFELTELLDGRVLAETVVAGEPAVALFEVRGDQVSRLAIYFSDRTTLAQIGEIRSAEPGPRMVWQAE